MQSPSCVVLRQLQKFTELSQRNFKSHEAFAVFFYMCIYAKGQICLVGSQRVRNFELF